MPAEIIQLHSDETTDLTSQIVDGLMRPVGQKQLPTMLLYDERGLRLYDDITTHAPEYYLFSAEEEILKTKADEIVQAMHRGEECISDEVVLELGAGALRKTSHILLGLSRLVPEASARAPITYYALDLEEREIERTLSEISHSNVGKSLRGRVETKGMCGTYDEGLKFIEDGGLNMHNSPRSSIISERITISGDVSPISSEFSSAASSRDSLSSPPTSVQDDPQMPLHILFLGSSLGNFSREGAATFLRSLPLRAGSGDTLLLGMDHDNDKATIEEAYNDPKGYTKQFIMNGLRAAGRVLGNEHMFSEDKWEYTNHYNVAQRQHEAYFKSKCAQTLQEPTTNREISFLHEEMLKIEESFKFSEEDAFELFTDSNLRPIQRWTNSSQQYSLWLLERPPFGYTLLKTPTQLYSPFGVPSLKEWEQLWSTWDCITRQMIPPSMLYQKPIELRNICLFYLGHIPTFLDIHLSKLLSEPHTEPEGFKYLFERGIDPNVDDPTQCHAHSEVPEKDEDWPTLTKILEFQSRVRERLAKLYGDISSHTILLSRRVGRVLFMTFEHEALHAETLLYMLLMRAGTGTLPPPGFAVPPWSSLAATWDVAPQAATKTVTLGPDEITLGHDDFEADDNNPINNSAIPEEVFAHEFGWDNENPKRVVQIDRFSIEWRPVTNGEFYQFYVGEDKGRLQLPASWVESDGEIKVRTLYGPVPLKIAQHWPVMTSYRNLSIYATVKGGRLPTEPELRLFREKFESGYQGGANVGFRNWHPVPATTGGERSAGKGSNGGVWEWTSTIFDTHEGFMPSELYPGYSMDFFDDAHQVVLGGSFATIPRISDRKTFRNWYQRNYPYAWIGGRVAYDIKD